MKPLQWVVLVLTLSACVPDPQTAALVPIAGACGADVLQGLVGQSAAVLQRMKFGQGVRIIRPGMAVTMDYSEGRLNIEIDGAEVIVGVRCG